MYLIEILHQTTTSAYSGFAVECCILSKFYIKPQRNRRYFDKKNRCILSKFYIKPQLCLTSFPGDPTALYLIEILHQTTTRRTEVESLSWLYLIEILHQTTTPGRKDRTAAKLYLIEILHQTTTKIGTESFTKALYLIEILHQTTTGKYLRKTLISCILSKFYIKPQPAGVSYHHGECCILSKFYIKPQRLWLLVFAIPVVSYRNSTSNHNSGTTTPNSALLYLIEILHQTTTTRGAKRTSNVLYLIEILHQTTTVCRGDMIKLWLYLIEILHQTTTA